MLVLGHDIFFTQLPHHLIVLLLVYFDLILVVLHLIQQFLGCLRCLYNRINVALVVAH